MFRFFPPKENIIRFGERISLFPHVRSSEVMAPFPPARTVALDLTFNLLVHHSIQTLVQVGGGGRTCFKNSKPDYRLFQNKLFSSGHFFLPLPSGLSLLRQLSDLTLSLTLGSGPSQTRNNLFWSRLSFHFPKAMPLPFLRFVLPCISCQELKGMTLHTVTHSSC